MSNLLDKNDRAVRAYLTPFVQGVNAGLKILIRNDSNNRIVTDDKGNNIGLVEVDSSLGNESPKGSGNYDVNVMVRVKFPAATQPNQGENDNRALLAELQTAVVDQLHVSDNNQDYHATARLISSAANLLAVDQSNGTDSNGVESAEENADMADYSALSVVHDNVTGGKNSRDQQDLNFYEVCNFKMNVVGYGGYWN
jgi:hypothetical protein